MSENQPSGCYRLFINLMVFTGVAWWTLMTIACCGGLL